MRTAILSAMILLAGPPAGTQARPCWGRPAPPAVAGVPFVPASAPIIVQPDDSLERAYARGYDAGHAAGRVEAMAKAREARRAMRAASAASCCSPACTCGCNDGSPCECGGVASGGPLFGRVDDVPPEAAVPEYYVGGKKVPRSECLDALRTGADRIPADKDLPSLSLFGGGPAARKALRKLLESDASLRPRVKWQDYDEDDPVIKGRGHRIKGLTIYLQDPDGKVLLREQELPSDAATAEGLLDRTKILLGLKPKPAPPAVPPAKTPDGKPAPGPDGKTPDAPAKPKGNGLIILLGAGAALALILLLARKDA